MLQMREEMVEMVLQEVTEPQGIIFKSFSAEQVEAYVYLPRMHHLPVLCAPPPHSSLHMVCTRSTSSLFFIFFFIILYFKNVETTCCCVWWVVAAYFMGRGYFYCVDRYFGMTQTERIMAWVLSPTERETFMRTDTADRERLAMLCIFGDADAVEKKDIMTQMTGPVTTLPTSFGFC